MKKLSLFLFAALSLSLFAASGVPGKVNVEDFLNVRQGPGLKYPVMGKLPAGTEIRILKICDAWLEAEAPESLPVFISEARLNANGKTNGEVNMRIRRDVAAPSYGLLPAGTEVKVLGERANGWVRIVPPAGLKVYAATICVTFDRKAFDEKGLPIVAKEPKKAEEKKEEPKKAEEAIPPSLTLKGTLIRWKFSKSPKTTYALVESPEGKNLAFITADNAALLEANEGKAVSVTGTVSEKNEAGVPTLNVVSLEAAAPEAAPQK